MEKNWEGGISRVPPAPPCSAPPPPPALPRCFVWALVVRCRLPLWPLSLVSEYAYFPNAFPNVSGNRLYMPTNL